MNKKIVQIETDHPLENFLGIESRSTLMEHTERVDDEDSAVSVSPVYDNVDTELDERISEIQKEALDAHDLIRDKMETTPDPRAIARLGEVDNQYLSTALHALALKAKIKTDKDKNASKAGSNNKKIDINTAIFMDRNEILKSVKESGLGTIIEGEK